jgi:XTP/dITP diphosphohydrolase
MVRKLLLATRNQNKKIELQQMLNNLDIIVLTFEDINGLPEVEEDGYTFEENAVKKSQVITSASGIVTLADDSGLVVDALDGQPGVYSARFAGEDADDEKNNDKLLRLMEDIPEAKRTARFICVIAVSDLKGRTEIVKGRCEGKIAYKPSGTNGFGYDPLFIPRGFDKTFAELSSYAKNSISHRGRALQQVQPVIKKVFQNY